MLGMTLTASETDTDADTADATDGEWQDQRVLYVVAAHRGLRLCSHMLG